MKSNEKNIKLIKGFFNEKSTRRDFLKWIGFSTASVTLAACKGPVIKSIPYITKPENVTLGNPIYYASTMMDSFDIGCVLIKTIEGRPIKIEPNSNSKYFNIVSARIQSSLLSLYDENRIKNPYVNGLKCNWNNLDNYVIQKLENIKKNKKDIVIISPSFPSYSTKKLIIDFQKKFPNTKWFVYDAISYSKALDASEKIFGTRAFPFFDLKKIELIISFDADFLGDWYPENMVKDYSKNRDPKKSMLKHIHIESNLSISGSNADLRIPKKPSQIKKILFEIYQSIFFKKLYQDKLVTKIVNLIKKYGNKCVIFADGDQESYELSYLINKKIDSNSLKNKKFILSKESNDKKFQFFIQKMEKKNIGALLILDSNPIYSLPFSIRNKIKKLIKNIPLKIYFSSKKNETEKLMDIVIPIPHWLESWGDTNPISNYYTLIQPTIQNIFNTRQFQDSLIIWGKIKENSYFNYLKKIWENDLIPKSNLSSFNEALYHGFLEIKTQLSDKNYNNNHFFYKKNYHNKNKNSKLFELRLYPKIGMGDGSQYNNPWLQEFPDPITRITWGNYLTISYIDANKIGLKNWFSGNGSLNGNCVNLIKYHKKIIHNIPVLIQPGQSIGSIGLSLGYGQKIGKISEICDGKNAYNIYEDFSINQYNIQLEKTDRLHKFASIQLYDKTFERDIIRETNLNNFLKKNKNFWNKKEKKFFQKESYSNWDNDNKKNKKGHHFNLSIDLNSCIGCGACVIACNSENNIPVVGKEEISKSRDMHWIRIDRYYSNNIHNPKINFQPIMCQHCEKAPCETVCPVGATTHSQQGQNMMTYNRCIGTRYCANNCPYKVRRFNWFDYANNNKFDFNMNNNLGKMVLNPDVVVRSRGVMEKCSLCIQRTQYTIIKSKKEKRKVKDIEFETACSISCPTKAISFGDIHDKESVINKKIKDPRSYKLLEFTGVNPNIHYLMKIKNTNEE